MLTCSEPHINEDEKGSETIKPILPEHILFCKKKKWYNETAYLVQLDGICMWKMIAWNIQMHKTWLHSATKQILCNDLADKVLSTTSTAVKAEYESFWRVFITEMTSNRFDDCITD